MLNTSSCALRHKLQCPKCFTYLRCILNYKLTLCEYEIIVSIPGALLRGIRQVLSFLIDFYWSKASQRPDHLYT
jgi:hypothetical protein